MFRILCISIESFATTSKPHIFFIRTFSSSPTDAKKPISKYVNKKSFTVCYLMNEFGFSLEKAVLASKHLIFENRDRPDEFVSFLKNQGFTQTQIRKVIPARCTILNFIPERSLLPKIEFYRSKGVSSTELAKMVGFNAQLLTRSLEGHIIPSFNSLRDLFGSDQNVIFMLKCDPRLLTCVEDRVKPNIQLLLGVGVPYSSIASLLKNRCLMFLCGSDKIKESLEKVQKMGLDPQSSSYSIALSILTVTPRSKWNEKMEAYKRWGCSEGEVLAVFKILPWIMSLSVKKINGVMSFCVNEIGLEPSEVVKRYYMLKYSLKKRIRPRWSVYQELVSKGLVKGEGNSTTMFTLKEDLFLEKYVYCYKNEAALLLKLYLEKLEASE